MDFQKMVRQFRENVVDESKPQPINEMASKYYRAAAEERVGDLESGTADTPLSWGSLFPEAAEGTNKPAPDGRATRMILDFIPNEMKMAIEIGKKLTKLGWTPDFNEKEVTQKRTIRNDQGEEERVATRENIAQLNYTKKIEKVIPKGPRAGEKIEKTMTSKLSQLIQKHGTPEEKEFWTKEQIRFTNIDTANEYFLRPWMRQYKDKDNATAVLITRHPIDVLRLSDFSNMKHSCWSEGSAFGHCSQDEALTGGPVAFLMPKAEIEKVSLQDLHGLEEVFSDSDIKSKGKTTAEPTARLRLISLRSENGADLAVPAKKVYGVNVPGFKGIVSDFVFDAQKDIIVRDGNADEFIGELRGGAWERTGGKYNDTEEFGGRIGELVADMVPVEAGVSEEQLVTLTQTSVPYDIYSGSEDSIDNQIDQAQERLDTLMREWNGNAQHTNVWLEAEQTDEDSFYIVNTADTMVSIPAPTEEQELKYNLSMIPHYENRNDFGDADDIWRHKRYFKNAVDEGVDATSDLTSYEYEDLEINLVDDNFEIRFTIVSADDAMGLDGVDNVEYWMDSLVDSWEQNHDELRRNIIVALQAEEYLPPAEGFASARADVSKEGLPNTFSNFEVEMMDPAKPAEGIVIGTKEQGRTNFALGVYDTIDKATGAEIPLLAVINGKARVHDDDPSDLFISELEGNAKKRIMKGLAAELQKLEDEAEEYAKQQLSLPLEDPSTQGELDLGSEYETQDKISYERQPQRVPEFELGDTTTFKFDAIEKMEGKVIIGIHLDFEVAVDATAENYGAIKAFVSYLDGNKDRLVEALQNLIDPFYEAIRASSINMQKQERERMQQKVSDAESAGKDPLAAGAYYKQDRFVTEETLRHVVREALKKKTLKEMASSSQVGIEPPDDFDQYPTSDADSFETDEFGQYPTSPSGVEPAPEPYDFDKLADIGSSSYDKGFQSDPDTGTTTVDGVPLEDIDPKLSLDYLEDKSIKHSSTGEDIGYTSKASESGKDGTYLRGSMTKLGGIDTISYGKHPRYGKKKWGNVGEDPGGISYGAHQLMTRMVTRNGKLVPTINNRTGKPYDPADSTMAKFLQSDQLDPRLRTSLMNTLKDKDGNINYNLLGGDGFNKVWTQITTNPESRRDFGQMQHVFNTRHHLDPLKATTKNSEKLKGIDPKKLDGLLQNEYVVEAAYGAAIQYGGDIAAKKFLIDTIADAATNNKLDDVEYIVNKFYDYRSEKSRPDVPRMEEVEEYILKNPDIEDEELRNSPANRVKDEKGFYKTKKETRQAVDEKGKPIFDKGEPKHPRTRERAALIAAIRDKKRKDQQIAGTGATGKPQSAPVTNESLLRHTIQEALKRKLSPLKEAEEKSSALLYQVVLVLSVSKPIRDIAGKLNRIRAIEGVTIVSHEREEDTIYRGDVVAKVKFHPTSDMMTPTTYINQYLVPQINSSKLVPEVKVLKVAQGTLKEI